MTEIARPTWSATITGAVGGTITLKVIDGTVALDESRMPYGQCTLKVALPDDTTLEKITPYLNQRLVVVLEKEWVTPTRSDQSRTFSFLLTEREIDHNEKTMSLTGETDEAYLIDGGNVSGAAENYTWLSLSTVVDAVLDKALGESLTTGASYSFRTDAKNLVPNPHLATVDTAWTYIAYGGSASAARSTSSPPSGLTAFWRITTTNALNTQLDSRFGNSVHIDNVEGGKAYVASAYARRSSSGWSASATFEILIQWRNAAGSVIQTHSRGPYVLAAGWNRYYTTDLMDIDDEFYAPDLAVSATLVFRAYNNGSNISNGATFDTSGAMLVNAHYDTGYFMGSTTDTSDYQYDWEDAANASPSIRTALLWAADIDSMVLDPGETYIDMLQPLLDAAGYRLYCDEQRAWHMVPPDYTVAGDIELDAETNVTRGKDLMSRHRSENGRPLWYSGVVVEYRWTRSDGVERVRYSRRGSDTKVHHIVVNRPWPGSGAATAILSRAKGRGRIQEVTALTDLATTPGQDLTIQLPNIPEQTGVVSSVVFSTTDTMDVGSRALYEEAS